MKRIIHILFNQIKQHLFFYVSFAICIINFFITELMLLIKTDSIFIIELSQYNRMIGLSLFAIGLYNLAKQENENK